MTATLNGSAGLEFVIDSGAADVQVPMEVFERLASSGTLSVDDLLPNREYLTASGERMTLRRFRLRVIELGGAYVVTDVAVAVGPPGSSCLLGQSLLSRIGLWSLDNRRSVLIIHDARSYRDTADLNSAYALIQSGEFRKALGYLDAAIERDRTNYSAFGLRGVVRAQLNDNDGAIRDQTAAIELNPRFANGYGSRGIVLFNLGRFREAEADFSKGLELNPDLGTGVFFRSLCKLRAICRHSLGNFRGVVADLNEYVPDHERDGEALYYRGSAWLQLDEPTRAADDLQASVVLEPESWYTAGAYYLLGVAQCATSEYSGAVSSLLKARELALKTNQTKLVRAVDAALAKVPRETGPPR